MEDEYMAVQAKPLHLRRVAWLCVAAAALPPPRCRRRVAAAAGWIQQMWPSIETANGA